MLQDRIATVLDGPSAPGVWGFAGMEFRDAVPTLPRGSRGLICPSL